MSYSAYPSGDFTVFGYSREPAEIIKYNLLTQLGVSPKIFRVGCWEGFVYSTNHDNYLESDEAVIIKLGFLRSMTKTVLNASRLMEQKLVGPRSINYQDISGNGMVVTLSKKEPVFSAYKTLLAVPQLYFATSESEIICSSALRCIVRLMPNCEIDEEVIPQHFLFRSTYGSSTYYRGVKRLLPGEYLEWVDGKATANLVKNLDTITDKSQYIRDEKRAIHLISEGLHEVVGDYVAQTEGKGEKLANLLSGGVDSTLLQYYINATSTQKPSRSVSFSIQGPFFDFEVKYAEQASRLLQTNHTFVDYTPQDFPGLLIRAIDILAQPPNLDTEPSMLAIAEFVQADHWQERFFFSGQAADGLFGLPGARKLKGLEYLRKLPFAVPALRGLGAALAPATSRAHKLLKGAEILADEGNPDAYVSPSNTISVYVEEWDIVQRSFGDQVLRKTLADRRNLAASFSNSRHYLEKVYFIDLLADAYEVASQRQQLFLAHHIEQVHPFLDEDIVKLSLSIHPDIRYLKGWTPKYLLKRLLAQKTNAPAVHLRKGLTTIEMDLTSWMKSGPLLPLVNDIHRPGFLSKADFDRIARRPSYLLWSLLTYDLLCKRIKRNHERSVISFYK